MSILATKIERRKVRDAARARVSLLRMKSLALWAAEGRRTPDDVRMFVGIVRELIKCARLTPEQGKAIEAHLDLDSEHDIARACCDA